PCGAQQCMVLRKARAQRFGFPSEKRNRATEHARELGAQRLSAPAILAFRELVEMLRRGGRPPRKFRPTHGRRSTLPLCECDLEAPATEINDRIVRILPWPTNRFSRTRPRHN